VLQHAKALARLLRREEAAADHADAQQQLEEVAALERSQAAAAAAVAAAGAETAIEAARLDRAEGETSGVGYGGGGGGGGGSSGGRMAVEWAQCEVRLSGDLGLVLGHFPDDGERAGGHRRYLRTPLQLYRLVLSPPSFTYSRLTPSTCFAPPTPLLV